MGPLQSEMQKRLPCALLDNAPHRSRFTKAIVVLWLSLVVAACTSAYTPAPHQHPPFEDWLIGGVQQRVWMRGPTMPAPVVLVLHGGPGVSATGLFRAYQGALEERYLMVYWDQRGTGRSYRVDLDPGEMTLARMIEDTREVVEQIQVRTGAEQVHLLGHSWGGLLAYEYASRYPQSLQSLILVAPALAPLRGERVSWEWTLKAARAAQDTNAVESLDEMGPPPHSVDQQLKLRRWTERLGGSFAGDMRKRDLIRSALSTHEVGLWDLYLFGAGNRFSLRALHAEITAASPDPQAVRGLDVITMLGRHDWQVPSVVGEAIARSFPGPCKPIVWFENAAHHIPFEQPQAFSQAVQEWVDAPGPGCTRLQRHSTADEFPR